MSNIEAAKASKLAANLFYPKHLVDGIDAREVRDVEKKVESTLTRLSRLHNWKCSNGWKRLKERCLNKLRKQRDFLLRTEAVKEDFLFRDDETVWEQTVDAINSRGIKEGNIA